MSKQEKIVRRKLYASSISTVVSISLVLFMLGLVGLVVLTSEKLSVMVKENIGFSVYLKDKTKEVDIIQIQKTLDAAIYTKSTNYVSKEEAIKILQEDLDPEEDFISFLDGHNPLPASIDVVLNSNYAHRDSISNIEVALLKSEFIREVVYSKTLVDLVNENIKQISFFILGFSTLLFLIAIALINNTIRLTLYSKRFLIKTMQLVGATKRFIRKPFIVTGILHGVFAAIIAIALLNGMLYLAQREMNELIELQDVTMIAYLFGGILVTGVLLSWISTYLALRKYLRIKTDELYY
ncbi:MAG TPA: FtsX-like permease family protein [Flavobacteriales bacterium]|nr:FtsX-like permease family protein [Flavobacteriales bacterium]